MKKILIIRFSSIGDIVLTSPVARILKKQLGAEVHYLTKRSFQAIVDPNPYIDKVYAIEKRVGEVTVQLRRERYDAVIDLHKNLRSLQVKWHLWRVPSFAFDKLNWEKWLRVHLDIDRLPDQHIVDRYVAAAAPLGVQKDGGGLDYFIPRAEEVPVAEFLKKHLPPDQQPPTSEFIAFVIGAAHATKRLPPDQITEVCRRLSLPVVLLGGKEDQHRGEMISTQAGPHVLNACGLLRLHQSASLVRQARCVITHDTGLMHIAAAFGKDIISVWGNTIPEFGMYPYYPAGVNRHSIVEVNGLSCRPCSKIGFRRCPRRHFRCMRDISDVQIVRRVEEII